MKKITLFTGIILLCINLNAIDKKDADNFGMFALSNVVDTLDRDLMGEWYLYNFNSNKYRQVKNDEFEFHDTVQEGYKQFIKLVNLNKDKIKNTEYKTTLKIEFNEYDFKNEGFPLDLIAENSYIPFYGSDKPTCNYAQSELSFDNANTSKNFLPIKKEDASKFVKSRKSNYSGEINRSLLAVITYTINSIDLKNTITNYSECVYLKVKGNIKNVDILDLNNQKIFTIENY
ncbi:DUF4852 domain-containing protein [Campylobacter blaseri]|uniref:DUF4852 domain-containing protein n=1 Tax=Campylobacter blaseri TaxID=2042961 RepID=UPI001300149A|nr:DUF4852 domain-containing protein [Campylobacter blaseri]